MDFGREVSEFKAFIPFNLISLLRLATAWNSRNARCLGNENQVTRDKKIPDVAISDEASGDTHEIVRDEEATNKCPFLISRRRGVAEQAASSCMRFIPVVFLKRHRRCLRAETLSLSFLRG